MLFCVNGNFSKTCLNPKILQEISYPIRNLLPCVTPITYGPVLALPLLQPDRPLFPPRSYANFPSSSSTTREKQDGRTTLLARKFGLAFGLLSNQVHLCTREENFRKDHSAIRSSSHFRPRLCLMYPDNLLGGKRKRQKVGRGRHGVKSRRPRDGTVHIKKRRGRFSTLGGSQAWNGGKEGGRGIVPHPTPLSPSPFPP